MSKKWADYSDNEEIPSMLILTIELMISKINIKDGVRCGIKHVLKQNVSNEEKEIMLVDYIHGIVDEIDRELLKCVIDKIKDK